MSLQYLAKNADLSNPNLILRIFDCSAGRIVYSLYCKNFLILLLTCNSVTLFSLFRHFALGHFYFIAEILLNMYIT